MDQSAGQYINRFVASRAPVGEKERERESYDVTRESESIDEQDDAEAAHGSTDVPSPFTTFTKVRTCVRRPDVKFQGLQWTCETCINVQ